MMVCESTISQVIHDADSHDKTNTEEAPPAPGASLGYNHYRNASYLSHNHKTFQESVKD